MATGILVSSTEPPTIKTLGKSSTVPERFGVDILVPSLRLGAQRKAFGDLVASLTGDRLAKEVMQMKRLVYKVLIVEGRPGWNVDGEWINGFQRFTLDQFWSVTLSLQTQGIMLLYTRDMHETVKAVRRAIAWVQKGSHESLSTRPKYLMSKWGTRDDLDWQAWVMQSFDGIGAKQARALVKHFGGAPLRWTVTEKDLMEVPGIGKERARRLIRALEERKAAVGS